MFHVDLQLGVCNTCWKTRVTEWFSIKMEMCIKLDCTDLESGDMGACL